MPTERKAPCVSIHDVAPATWPACQRLLRAIHEVAEIPLTLLVVPCYHGSDRRDSGYEAMLGALLERGHELALHGYRHLDQGPPASGLGQRWLRGVYTRHEGEFAALGVAESRWLLAQGLEWFGRRGWPVDGFVPPAAGLVRLSLHPADAAYPELLRHAQHLVASMLESRAAMTKSAFARLSRSVW